MIPLFYVSVCYLKERKVCGPDATVKQNLCVCVCICVHVKVFEHTCGGQRLRSGLCQYLSTLFLETEFLTEPGAHCLAGNLQGVSPVSWITGLYYHTWLPTFPQCGSWGLNSTFVANTLLTEPFPQPCYLYFTGERN